MGIRSDEHQKVVKQLATQCSKANLKKNHMKSFQFRCDEVPIPRYKNGPKLWFNVLAQSKINKLHLSVGGAGAIFFLLTKLKPSIYSVFNSSAGLDILLSSLSPENSPPNVNPSEPAKPGAVAMDSSDLEDDADVEDEEAEENDE